MSKGNEVVSITSEVSNVLNDHIIFNRKPVNKDEKTLFLNKFGRRIGEHFIRNHLKECAIEAGLQRNIYPHMLRASYITHILNNGINPLTV